MDNICKSFGTVQVLKNAKFDLHPSEVHILAGENGAGKSTLMKILGGILTDYSGTIRMNQDASVRFSSVQEASAHGISIIHQELSLVGSLSVYENIFLGRELHRFSWVQHEKMKKEVRKLLAELGLDINVSHSADQLPIGLQQMVEIAKALSCDSKIIVMDEPTSALTEPEVEKLFTIIAQLKQSGCGIVYISHKMEEIYQIADRITVLRDGRYIGTETAENLPSDKLVQWMVGRELNKQFARTQSAKDDVRLEAARITVPGPPENPVPVVDDVSFEVRAGEILGIAGLQGSGNSQLLHSIFGSFGKAAEGALKIDGVPKPITDPASSIQKGLALLTNDRKSTGLVIEMDILRNASLASLKKFSSKSWLHPSAERKAVSQTVQSLRLKAESLHQPVNSLSGGNQQKVVLAKWIQTEPKVLLLDEPTRGVDVGAKQEIYDLMNQWTQAGLAIVLITSELPELLAMSDRILTMHRGRVTAEFTREQATQEKILNAALGQTEELKV
ncbi:Ribose import ATP-binding protein RbsA [Sedimentisphaera cyanobacteriorum]|uniref:Ribose import ATP-binding protein RbsA n=2 Tax=Sedimentisphaera cyanobacteriorum TaxID=1940790 RepID=A0A1Q2HRC2_9BACT|nr:Ribose import ATP-binding protein RbsA [Sedimentisphaera cyanobacteriorum]